MSCDSSEPTKKVNHGGSREGAGRPKKYGVETKRVPVFLPRNLLGPLQRAAKRNNQSVSAYVVGLIRLAIKGGG